MKRWQWVVFFIWIGLPLVAIVSLFLLSPSYMNGMFMPLAGIDGLTLFLGLIGLNFLVLLVWFNLLNQRQMKTKVKNEDSKSSSFINALLLIFTFVFLTLPSLWIAFMYPSLARLISSTYS